MTLSDLPLSKIFWNIFAIEAVLIGALLFKAVQSFSDSKPTDGGMVGAWLILVSVVALALVGCLFLLFKAPAVQATLTLLLLFPVVGSVVAAPIHWVIQKVKDSRMVVERERDRLGEYIFQEPGARAVATAVADRDLARIKAALPNAGDINRIADFTGTYSTQQTT